ncbi:MAG: CHAT domain-containing protein, partial [Psychroserpens sp.]|nr:CHAT domain-containing protein [Psychroserpens sp.]
NNLAFYYLKTSQYDEALKYFLEAKEGTEKILGKEHPNYGVCLENLTGMYQVKGLYKKALPNLLEANNIVLTNIKANFTFQTKNEKENYLKNIMTARLSNISNFNYLTQNSFPDALRQGTNNILTQKGLLLNASKDILLQLQSLNDSTVNSKILHYKSKRTSLDQQFQLPKNERITNIKEEQNHLEVLERDILKIYEENFGKKVNYVKDFNKTLLKTDEVAVEFTRFDFYKSNWTDSTMYSAYLYKKDWETPKVVDLFEEKQLQDLLSSVSTPKELYQTRGTTIVNQNTTAIVSDSIYHLVWKPLEKYIKPGQSVYYSPDGLLHKIPFAALPNSDNKLLAEIYDLNQMGNTADIRINNSQPDLQDMILIGGVDYTYVPENDQKIISENQVSILEADQLLGNEANKTRGNDSGSWTYLKGTKKEVDRINELLPTSKVLSQKEATETAFKSLSGNSPSVLHIATHGYFFPDLEDKKQKRNLDEKSPYIQTENPLLRSGLILANANYAWKNGSNPYEEDDGILTGLEISNLDLKNTDIVVLSACETGLGDIPSSEGVYGLQRAFKMAGVNTIIMTLWEVPDKETAE